MFQAHRPENEPKNKKEMKMMEKEYKKTVIFRKERVAEIKKRIQSNQYHVSGAAVVDKWFPSNAEGPGHDQE